jgi:hypothetical protein
MLSIQTIIYLIMLLSRLSDSTANYNYFQLSPAFRPSSSAPFPFLGSHLVRWTRHS